MNQASGSLGIPTPNARSFLLTSLVLLLVIALFFIPELIDFQRNLTSTDTAPSKAQVIARKQAPLPIIETSPTILDKSKSTLSQVSHLLDSGYIDEVKARKVVARTSKAKDDASVSIGTSLSWDNVRQPKSIEALKKAEKSASQLLKSIQSTAVASRYALYNFISGVNLVINDSMASLTADEAVRYLGYLYNNVLTSFSREEIARADYNNWVELSLGPVVDNYIKSGSQIRLAPFDPQLTLTNVDIFKPGARNTGSWIENGPVYLSFSGTVHGKDITRIEVYHDKEKVTSLFVKGANRSGERKFLSRKLDARGIYTLRVYNESGQVYQKTYSFYPRVRAFSWNRGHYEIPYTIQGGSRLDRFFTLKRGRTLGHNSAGTSLFADSGQIARF